MKDGLTYTASKGDPSDYAIIVEILSDEWTTVTADGKLSAHFEHSVAITPDGPQILTLPDD